MLKLVCNDCGFESTCEEDVPRWDCNGDEVHGEQYDHGIRYCHDCARLRETELNGDFETPIKRNYT